MSDRPDVGDPMPEVAVTGADGHALPLAAFRGRPLVVFFYPKDDTPGCTTENKDFSALAGEFARLGAAVLGVSKDPPARHARFVARHGLEVALASDAATDGLAEALGIWVEKALYGRKYMGMERTTFLVGADGRIARVWRKVKVKGHAAEVLAAAEAQTQGVCPPPG
jgi:thioredoxin-dependent peroxiredoxin